MNYLSETGTFSKSPASWGFEPEFEIVGIGIINGCKGSSRVMGNDGRSYLDWVCGLGGNLLGHNHHDFVERVVAGLRGGVAHSLPHYLEREVAEKLCNTLGKHVPFWHKDSIAIRFGKTGTDAVNMAIRLARAVTGKSKILTFEGHYHGWGDWTIARTPPAHGIPKDTINHVEQILFNDLCALQKYIVDHGDQTAAVIYEYPAYDPNPSYLKWMMEILRANKILLIADEIVTGFRWGLGGACEHYGITPDIMCLGKALGNGVPISAVVGTREIMHWFRRNDPVFCSSTFWGETTGLAAADAVLDLFTEKHVDYIWGLGRQLMGGLKTVGVNVSGHPPRSLLNFDGISQRAFFIHKMREQGILMNRPNFISIAHSPEDTEKTIQAADSVMKEMAMIDPDTLSQITQPIWPRILFRNR